MSQKKILIIEDSTDLADSLEDMLILKGYQTLKANNGEKGIALAFNEEPHLILLDLKLPDIDGYEVLRSLRNNVWGKNVRVLILTASDTTENIPIDLDIKREDILSKSNWGIGDLANRIEVEFTNLNSWS